MNDAEPIPASAEVVAPDWLPGPAREVWASLAPDLVARGVLTPWDSEAFAIFCSAVVIARQAFRDVEVNGSSSLNVYRILSDGTTLTRMQKNPSWSVAREAAQLVVTLGSRFGLTPVDRAQLHVDPGTSASANDDLLSGRYLDPSRLLS